jgi:hypothetical protein
VKRYRQTSGSATRPDNLAESTFCVGDACAAVSVLWDPEAGSYLVCNRSRRPVWVQFKTWPSSTLMQLAPGSEARLHAETLDYPYRASYESS